MHFDVKKWKWIEKKIHLKHQFWIYFSLCSLFSNSFWHQKKLSKFGSFLIEENFEEILKRISRNEGNIFVITKWLVLFFWFHIRLQSNTSFRVSIQQHRPTWLRIPVTKSLRSNSFLFCVLLKSSFIQIWLFSWSSLPFFLLLVSFFSLISFDVFFWAVPSTNFF